MEKEIKPAIKNMFIKHFTCPCTSCKKFWAIDGKTSCKDVCEKYVEWKVQLNDSSK